MGTLYNDCGTVIYRGNFFSGLANGFKKHFSADGQIKDIIIS